MVKLKNRYLSLLLGKRGFTLIEMIVVMVMVALLAALVGPKLFSKVGKGK